MRDTQTRKYKSIIIIIIIIVVSLIKSLNIFAINNTIIYNMDGWQ